MCTENGVKTFLEANKKQPVEPYATPAYLSSFLTRMSRDSFHAPQQWYRSMALGEQDIANKSVPAENVIVNVPTLFWGGSRDMVCRPELLGPSVEKGLLPRLKTVVVEEGHWALLARPREFGEALMEWLREEF